MPGPKLPEYPKPMFRGDTDPVYARNAKHEDELAEQGWSAAYIWRQYPRMLYHQTERKTITVENKADEDARLAEGWIREPGRQHYGETDPGIPNLPLPAPPDKGAAVLKSEIDDLKETIRLQNERIDMLLSREEARTASKAKKVVAD